MLKATAKGKVNTVLQAALAYQQAGLSVIPIRLDGSKTPPCKWKRYETEIAADEQIRRWFDVPCPPGIAVVYGKVSSRAELIDFDIMAEEIYPAWCELVEAEGPGLIARLSVAKTPRPGYQTRYRVADFDIPGNTDLATDAATGKKRIETRGEGGYAIAPGSPPAVHVLNRPYAHYSGPREVRFGTAKQ